MSFLNRFLIEEDIQFECAGVVEHKRDMETKMKRNIERDLMKNLERISNESNSIGHLVLSTDLEYSSTYSIFDNIKNLTMMMTRINSERLECVQQEQYNKLYKDASNEGGQIKYGNKTVLVYTSIGDDIDDFYDRIKMNKIKFTDKRNFLDYSDFQARLDNLLQARHSVKTFNLSTLSEEERKMHSEKTGNRRSVNVKYETRLFKKENKYALTLGARKTLFCMSKAMRGKTPLWNVKVHVWDVLEPRRRMFATNRFVTNLCPEVKSSRSYFSPVEPDPWQERIKKNFEELQKQMEKIKSQQALEALEALEYYQTHCESDSSDNLESN